MAVSIRITYLVASVLIFTSNSQTSYHRRNNRVIYIFKTGAIAALGCHLKLLEVYFMIIFFYVRVKSRISFVSSVTFQQHRRHSSLHLLVSFGYF